MEDYMARFFFNFRSRTETIHDTKGAEFTDLASAHRHAMMLIYRMVLLDELDWKGWSVDVTNANHRSVLAVLFPESCHCAARYTQRQQDGEGNQNISMELLSNSPPPTSAL
jgi:hypothetical protein